MKSKLSEAEYKQLIMEVAIKISPTLIHKERMNSAHTAESISLYARDIADAVELVINQKYV